ncbi:MULTISPECIES: hypothetical protein [Pseudomonas]|uniref:HEPN domain-containing protein n=1 Tax=Pseudomonas aphyarum TaxID=2942629 RepID=A0ABT5PJD0_9PSED|nr:hypothetical protein [Pseudomonas aphyarum]MDD0968304.1 hypothetical protein [Pseudomonas aphyarum]MDD1124003.1 hypothetical protein [Pseudomonas aphyarum]
MKSYKYGELISRMESAVEEEFYLEACWIAYSILEDRLTSILKESGGGHEKIRMMGPKLKEINTRTASNLNMRKAFFGNMLIDVEQWKNKRNSLMHAMADESRTIFEIDDDAMTLAKEGKEIVRTLCAACRRFKKMNSKSTA